jgi:hypothetical protein
MSIELSLKRDERTVAVENASFRWAWHFLVWPLILDALYRQKTLNEDPWDLIALVCVSSAIAIVYQWRHNVLVSYWPWQWKQTAIVFAVSIVVALLILSIAFFA